MIFLEDYFIVRPDSFYAEKKTATGLETLNTAWIMRGDRDENEFKCLKGTIIASPIGYSLNRYSPIDRGLPNHRLFISHDRLQYRENTGANIEKTPYHPGMMLDFKYLSFQDYAQRVTAKKGDQVYFHPHVTEQENLFPDGTYKVRVDQLICTLDPICPQGQYVLIQPVMESEDEITMGGFQIKIEAQVKALQGIVRYTNNGMVSAGDHVIFEEASDWEVDIEGEKFYVMQMENLLMKLKPAV